MSEEETTTPEGTGEGNPETESESSEDGAEERNHTTR